MWKSADVLRVHLIAAVGGAFALGMSLLADHLGAPLAVTLVPFGITMVLGTIVLALMPVLIYTTRRDRRMVHAGFLGRPPMSDGEFMGRSGLEGDSFARAVARLRSRLARHAGIPPARIYPEDSLEGEFGSLLDSLDVVELIMCLEEDLGLAITDEIQAALSDRRTIGAWLAGLAPFVPSDKVKASV